MSDPRETLAIQLPEDAVENAARELHRWNTEDAMLPRFVFHDVGSPDEDPYVTLVRKILALVESWRTATHPASHTSEPREENPGD